MHHTESLIEYPQSPDSGELTMTRCGSLYLQQRETEHVVSPSAMLMGVMEGVCIHHTRHPLHHSQGLSVRCLQGQGYPVTLTSANDIHSPLLK